MRPKLRCVAVLVLALPTLACAAGVQEDVDPQRSGARIGRILIQIDDVFENASRLAAPYRLANSLHVSTQQETVQRQLLFQSGDPYDPRVLAESERLLRSQSYLNEADIRPVEYRGNEVDVLVRVHDVWSLSPGISLGRAGGENSARVKLEDSNFLGRGKHAQIASWSDVDRSAWRFAYNDPNVLGSRWQMAGAYASMSDGEETALAVRRPFYSLATPWSAGVAASEVTSAVSRYSLGQVVGRVDMQERVLGLDGGISEGLVNGWAKRYLGGVRSESRKFSPHPDETLTALPEDRDLVYPWVGMELVEDDYVRTRNLDQIGRTEDLYLGRRARFEVGLASSAFGSTRDAVTLGGALQMSADLGHERYWINCLDTSGRIEDGDLVDGRFTVNSRYYLRHSMRRVSFASVTAALTSDLDPEEQLLLGGDNGLRGYPLRYQAGTSSALLTLEERFYTAWQPLKLFDVGAALFFDAGRTWGRSEGAAEPAGWLADVGFGLRLGSARSALGNVLHVDLAFPLNGAADIDGVQLLIETRKSF